MTNFDQRGQRVNNQNNAGRDIKINYQYNAAGDINLDSVQNQVQLIEEIGKLKSEVSKAAEAQIIDAEVFTDVDHHMTRAIEQAKKPEPDKKGIVNHLNSAKSFLEGVTAASGIVTALNKVVQLVVGFF